MLRLDDDDEGCDGVLAVFLVVDLVAVVVLLLVDDDDDGAVKVDNSDCNRVCISCMNRPSTSSSVM